MADCLRPVSDSLQNSVDNGQSKTLLQISQEKYLAINRHKCTKTKHLLKLSQGSAGKNSHRRKAHPSYCSSAKKQKLIRKRKQTSSSHWSTCNHIHINTFLPVHTFFSTYHHHHHHHAGGF